MNIYRGTTRRQVGGGLFSNLGRGIRPLVLSLLAKLKPHVINAGKTVGKRAAKAALNVGTDMAGQLITGRLNKSRAKNILKTEFNDIKSDAANVVKNYKRKAEEAIQGGSGRKKRRKNMPKRRRTSARSQSGRRRRRSKVGRKTAASKKSINGSLKRKAYRRKAASTKKVINKTIQKKRKKSINNKQKKKQSKLGRQRRSGKKVFNSDIFGK